MILDVSRRDALVLCALFCLALALLTGESALAAPHHGDRRAMGLLNKVIKATNAAHVLTADFSYVVTDAYGIRGDVGVVELMKPNYAVIAFNKNMKTEEAIISDGTTIWTYRPPVHQYKSTPADPLGKNVNLWRIIPIGVFFDLPAWLQNGLNLSDLTGLTHAGKETVNGTVYQVLERKTTGMIQKQPCPMDQKLYIGSDNLIHRTQITYQFEGKPGREVAELTNLKLDAKMTPADFTFTAPPDAAPTHRFAAAK